MKTKTMNHSTGLEANLQLQSTAWNGNVLEAWAVHASSTRLYLYTHLILARDVRSACLRTHQLRNDLPFFSKDLEQEPPTH